MDIKIRYQFLRVSTQGRPVAAELKQALNVDAKLEVGSSGELTVWVDDAKVAEKKSGAVSGSRRCGERGARSNALVEERRDRLREAFGASTCAKCDASTSRTSCEPRRQRVQSLADDRRHDRIALGVDVEQRDGKRTCPRSRVRIGASRARRACRASGDRSRGGRLGCAAAPRTCGALRATSASRRNSGRCGAPSARDRGTRVIDDRPRGQHARRPAQRDHAPGRHAGRLEIRQPTDRAPMISAARMQR